MNTRLTIRNFGPIRSADIDFDKYTLIIGQQIMPYCGFYVAKKELKELMDQRDILRQDVIIKLLKNSERS